jgi:hypothetical protein
MADNGIHVFLVDGSHLATFGISNTSSCCASITDPDFPGADQVTFQDGYFIFNKPDSQVFFISAIDDVTLTTRSTSRTAEGSPDNVVGVHLASAEALVVWLAEHEAYL